MLKDQPKFVNSSFVEEKNCVIYKLEVRHSQPTTTNLKVNHLTISSNLDINLLSESTISMNKKGERTPWWRPPKDLNKSLTFPFASTAKLIDKRKHCTHFLHLGLRLICKQCDLRNPIHIITSLFKIHFESHIFFLQSASHLWFQLLTQHQEPLYPEQRLNGKRRQSHGIQSTDT